MKKLVTRHHLERHSSGLGVLVGALEETGQDLIPAGPARNVPAMSGCHELFAGVERQAIILGGPDLHAVKQPPRSDEYLPLSLRRPQRGLGPTIHSSRDPTSRIVDGNP
jgi:hypothetical protein